MPYCFNFYHKITATPPYYQKFVYLYKFAEWALSFLAQKVPKELGIMEKTLNSSLNFSTYRTIFHISYYNHKCQKSALHICLINQCMLIKVFAGWATERDLSWEFNKTLLNCGYQRNYSMVHCPCSKYIKKGM